MARTNDPTEALTVEALARYWEVFSCFDTNGDGAISVAELVMAVRAVGQAESEEAIQAILDSHDVDHSGGIDFDEFLRWGARAEKEAHPEAVIEEAFTYFDTDADGFLDLAELTRALSRLQLSLPDEVLATVAPASDGDPRISYAEFQKLTLSGI